MKLRINGEYFDIDADPKETLLHVLRDHLHLMPETNGCDSGECCGACTVLINGKGGKACMITLSSLDGDRVRTIEGIPEEHPVIKAWRDEGVQECPVCKSGQIMKSISLLARMLNPAPVDIEEELNTEHCECGNNPKIIRAINKASKFSYDS